MSSNNQINFQVSLKNKSDKSLKDNTSLEVRQAIQSVCSIFHDKQLLASTTFAIRYLKDDKNNASPVKTFFSVSRTVSKFSIEEIEAITAILDSKLGKLFRISSCQLDWQNAISTNAVSQIVKDEFFDLANNLYAPKFLTAARSTNLQELIEFMERQSSNIALEVCLQPYYAPDEKVRWKQAINQMIQVIKSDESFKHLLADYENYEKLYSNRDPILPVLFNYSIKAYGDHQGYVHALLNDFRDNAISPDRTTDCLVNKFDFQSNALVKVGQTGAIPRPEWQNNSLVNIPIKKIVKAPKKEGWKSLVDSEKSSLNIDNWLSSGISLQNLTSTSNPMQALPQGANQSNQGQLAPSQGGQIVKSQPQAAITIADLKPLHQMVCLEEIQGFLSLGVSESMVGHGNDFRTLFTIQDVINEFGHLITEETYVAGIDQDGKPCISDFTQLAHRLVGGMTRTGKTNYILSVVYQFIHADPEREVFMIDFQAGLHYEFTIKKRKNVEMVTSFEDCDKLLKAMLEKHSQRRQEMTDNRCRGRKELFEKTGIKQNRILLIIDEAFYLKNNSDRDSRRSIETNLNTLAAQASVTGIHILYSTQTPTSEVIDSQTLNNIGERTLFAIESSGDSRRIIGDDGAYELPLIPKGRALYKGANRKAIEIATPFVPDEVW